MNELEKMKLAFRLHVAEQIVGADAEVHAQEAEHLRFLFPADTLERAGFIDAEGNRTQVAVDAAMEALEVLPGTLDIRDKVAMLTEFLGAVLADGEFHRKEGVALVDAAHLLELEPSLIQDFLDAHLALGGVKAADLED